MKETWQLISLTNLNKKFSPRSCTIVCSLNLTQILIMGGIDVQGDANDVFLFDTESEQLQKVAEGGIAFRSDGNAGVAIGGNRVVAIALIDYGSHLIGYTLG